MLCAAGAAVAEEPESPAALASMDVALDVLQQHRSRRGSVALSPAIADLFARAQRAFLRAV